MARLPKPEQQNLPAGAERAWELSANPDGTLRGPHGALIYVPALSERIAELGDQLRNHGRLPDADRELAILATAREREARFAWQAHERAGLAAGTRPEAIEIIRAQGALDGLTPRERTIVEVVRSLCREHRIPDALFARAQSELGDTLLVELVALSGYYGLIGFVLNAFEIDLPANAKPTF
jgi:4-carboxymuconolactone decarboxylase